MNQSNEGPPANFRTCRCRHCDKGIEFDANDLGRENSVVPCPHCGLETMLFVPPTNSDWVAKIDLFAGLQKDSAGVMKIASNNDDLELTKDSIIIRKRGLANALAAGLNGERMIPISTLTAIQLKLGAWWSPGYILFSYAGSKPFMGGIIEATQDPDAFIFPEKLNDEISVFKAEVEKIMRDSKQPAYSNKSTGTISEELRKLAEFKQQGILSEEEFTAAKKKLLT